MTSFPQGLPGVLTARTASHNDVLAQHPGLFAPGLFTIDGTKSRDAGNSDISVLRGGLPMGKVTSGGLFRPWYVGLVGADAASGATSLTVAAAVATEIARLRSVAGGNINVVLIGPPAAAGTVAVLAAVACSAASGTTLTVAAIGANIAAGSLICISDGSQTVKGLCFEPWGTKVTDPDGASISVPMPQLLIGGNVVPSRIPLYSSMDASVKTYFKTQLKTVGPYTFTDDV